MFLVQDTLNPPTKAIHDADFKLHLANGPKSFSQFLKLAQRDIDLDKNSTSAYSTGKFVADQKQIALTEIRNTKVFVAKLRTKRTVDDELAVKEFLDSFV